MKRLFVNILILVIFAMIALVSANCSKDSRDFTGEETPEYIDVFLTEGIELASSVEPEQERIIRTLLHAGSKADQLAQLKIDYPLDESIFPQEIVAPRFLWHDSAEKADAWLIDVALGNGSVHIYSLTSSDPLPAPKIDRDCVSENNEFPKPTPYQATASNWLPVTQVWDAIKKNSVEQTAIVTIYGFNGADPGRVLSSGQMTMKTSKDLVGAPIFYRDVPLMPSPVELGVQKPLSVDAFPLVKWHLRDISRHESRVVLTDIPTCANCHSFSKDGSTLGMDIDGPQGDKGAYAVADIEENMVIQRENVVSWNYSFKEKPKGQKTIGLLSQISPDGQYAITTLNETLYAENFLDYKFLQVVFPTRGILAYYSKKTGEIKAMPGADDPDYVQCDGNWSPDGKYIVFARAKARDPYVKGQEYAQYANAPEETPMKYDLYRIPFNDGKGGKAEPILGASNNGMSNHFPKVSWDDKYIVFVKCRNGQLQRPDGRLWIVPAEGGEAREMRCNTSLMNSWHSFSPNSRWMVFSSKSNTPYTQMFITHIDENGNDSPGVLIPNSTAANRAVNIPEFVNISYDDLISIEIPEVEYQRFLDHAETLNKNGKNEEAFAELNKALGENPDDKMVQAEIRQNMGAALGITGKYEEAIDYFKEAVKIDPQYTKAYVNHGIVLEKMGRIEEAVSYYKQAIRIDPRDVQSRYKLASIRMSGKYPALRDVNEAIALSERACELTYYRDPVIMVTLANAYAEAGGFQEAVENAENALELARTSGRSQYVRGIQERLAAYKQGKTFRTVE